MNLLDFTPFAKLSNNCTNLCVCAAGPDSTATTAPTSACATAAGSSSGGPCRAAITGETDIHTFQKISFTFSYINYYHRGLSRELSLAITLSAMVIQSLSVKFYFFKGNFHAPAWRSAGRGTGLAVSCADTRDEYVEFHPGRRQYWLQKKFYCLDVDISLTKQVT